MSIDELSKQYNDLLQQRANKKYRKSELLEEQASIDMDLAKIQGKLELLEAMAKEMQEAKMPDDIERMEAAEVKRQSKRDRRNGVVIPEPEPEEEEAA